MEVFTVAILGAGIIALVAVSLVVGVGAAVKAWWDGQQDQIHRVPAV